MKQFKKNLLFLFLWLIALSAHAQWQNFETTLGGAGFGTSNETLPFWLVANNNGAAGSETNYLFFGNSSIDYRINDTSFLSAGAGFFLHDGTTNDFERDQLYLSYTNNWIAVTLGSKHTQTRFNGLSIANNNFLTAGNNRALPGILIESPKPIRISDRFDLEYGLGHFLMNDDRFVTDTRVHFKKVGVNWNVSKRVTLVGQLHHYAMWNGISPERGELPDDLDDFRDVFLGRAGEGEERNSLGNHLGLYNFEMHVRSNAGTYVFYHQHPFEDGSGSALKNFPDGIWGFAMLPETENYTAVFKGLVLEYIQTTSQSGGAGDAGRDNYFNNIVYQSGWSYEGRIIGLPLISKTNTRIQGIHAGIMFGVKRLDVMFKTTLTTNKGTFFNPLEPNQDNIYSVLQVGYSLNKYGSLSTQIGYDYLSELQDVFGGSLSYRYTF